MRILFYISQMGGGGAERVTSIVASGLARRGHEVYIIVKRIVESEYEMDNHIHIVLVEGPKQNKHQYYLDVRAKVEEINPDVMIGVMHLNFYRLWLVTQGLNIPIVASDHNTFHKNTNDGIKIIRYNFYNNADVTTVLTNNDKEFMKDRLHNMRVIYNPLSFPILDHPVEREKTVLCAGRLNSIDIKGFDRMIEMWGQIYTKHPDWILKIAGTGKPENFKYLEQLISEYPNMKESVQLLGFRDDIQDIMAHSSIFALPSREEGFPCVLIEAMSQGCAPVSFEIHGNIKEIITDGQDGFLIPDGDLVAFEGRLELLMDNVELRNEISKKAMKSMESLEPEKIVDQWEEMLQELVDKNK